jgi:nucleotide-binding universal stress UspA family protein
VQIQAQRLNSQPTLQRFLQNLVAAYTLATAYGARLYFFHVADDAWNEPLSTRMPGDASFRRRLLEKDWPPREEGIEPEFLVEFGSPEVRTLEVADQRGAQLIVLNVHGTTHPDLSADLPGPLAYDIVSHARCPVLVVRGAAAPDADELLRT